MSRSSLPRSTASTSKAARSTATRPDGSPIEIPYDSLIVAAGAGQSYFGHDEFSRWAPGMKTINDALELRGRILGAFEMAELENDPEKRGSGSPSWSSAAARPAWRSRGRSPSSRGASLKDDFRRSTRAAPKILLFDGGKEVLATFGDRLSGKASKGLESLGIELHMSSIVTDVDRDRRGRQAGGRGAPHPRAHQDLGGRRPGLPARPDAG